jgi:hypothetical protein
MQWHWLLLHLHIFCTLIKFSNQHLFRNQPYAGAAQATGKTLRHVSCRQLVVA